MNRFLPMNYSIFKRLAKHLKRELGLYHCEALALLAEASGFRNFQELAVACRSSASNLVPSVLQYAGDEGYYVWSDQLEATIGSEDFHEVEPMMRSWYQWIFEVGGDPVDWPEYEVETDPTKMHPDEPLANASSDEVSDDLEVRSVSSNVPVVVVTYRRRRRLIEQAPATTKA